MLCKCGQDSWNDYLYRKYDDDHNIIYEICVHGMVVEDNAEFSLEDEDFLDTLIKRYSKK